MKFTLRVWHFNQWLKIYGRSNEFKKGASLFKAGILSIVFGAIISFIVIGINDVNPFLFLGKTFELAFNNQGNVMNDYTLTYFAIYILGGLAVAVGFKTGIFNIGVSGQMLLAGSMVVTFGIMQTNYDASGAAMGMHMDHSLALFLSFVIAVVVGSFLASIAGALKAYFHIHEVVSSIMLNWVVWYFTKWLFTANNNLYDSNVIGSKLPDASFSINVGGYGFVIPIILAFVIVAIVFILMKYTTLGYKLRGVGYSPEACRYAGVNIKANIIGATAISGAIAGVLGFVYYLTISQQIQYTSDALPTEGFDSIAITLVAFNNPIGVIPVSLIWGIIKVGAIPASQAPGLKMSKDMASLVFGIIIYGAAISSLFLRLQPVLWLKRYTYFWRQPKYRAKMQEFNSKIHQERKSLGAVRSHYHKDLKAFKADWNKLHSQASNKQDAALQYLKARSDFDFKYKDQKSIHAGTIKNLRLARAFYREELWKESFTLGRKGVRTTYRENFYTMTAYMLDAVVNLNGLYITGQQKLNNKYQYKLQLRAIRKEYHNIVGRIRKNKEANAKEKILAAKQAFLDKKVRLQSEWLANFNRQEYRKAVREMRVDVNNQFRVIKNQTVKEYAKYKVRRDDALHALEAKGVN